MSALKASTPEESLAGASAFELIQVPSGAMSLRSLLHRETFHPGIGPLAEATILHVEQQRLVERAARPGRLVIWDVGLGAAANAIAAWNALPDPQAEVEIHSFDISTAPLAFALAHAASLEYLLPYLDFASRLVEQKKVELGPRRRWFFHAGDFRSTLHDPALPSPHAILYDPYSPATNREMWTLDHFHALRKRLAPGGYLTNYTRSTAVRVTLLLAGFRVGIGAVIGDKDQTTIATDEAGTLARPLARDWLERVKISRNGAPVRGGAYRVEPISPEDLTELASLPQFRA